VPYDTTNIRMLVLLQSGYLLKFVTSSVVRKIALKDHYLRHVCPSVLVRLSVRNMSVATELMCMIVGI
jgi:hypothetical protein